MIFLVFKSSLLKFLYKYALNVLNTFLDFILVALIIIGDLRS